MLTSMMARIFAASNRAGDLATADFCPGLNRYVYWLKKPIGLLILGTAMSLILGIYVAPQAMAIAGVVATLAVIGCVWPWLSMRGVTANLCWQRTRCTEGDSIEVILTVTNRWPWPLWGLMIEANSDAINLSDRSSSSIALASVPPLATTQFRWSSTPKYRGVYGLQPSYIASGFPLGVWISRTKLTIETPLLVWPKTETLSDIPQLGGEIASIVGSLKDRAGQEGDFIGVRPYRVGDSMRSIHWAQTARRDQLIVCERQSKAHQSIVVEVLTPEHIFSGDMALQNCDSPPSASEHSQSHRSLVEWKIRLAATLCRQLLSHHWTVTCKIGERQVTANPGPAGLNTILDLLARFGYETLDRQHLPGHGSTGLRNPASQTVLRIASESDFTNHALNSNSTQSSVHWFLFDGSSDSSGHQKPQTKASSVWMRIAVDGDVVKQVRNQWERVCHDTTAVAS